MNYNNKRTIISMVAGALITAAYIIYAMGERAPHMDDIKSWSISMLIFIAVGVVALIFVQIIFHVILSVGVAVKEQNLSDKEVERIISSEMVEDEREKVINLKSAHIGYICTGIGVVAMLIALATGVSVVISLHILFGSLVLSSELEGVASLYFNKVGI